MNESQLQFLWDNYANNKGFKDFNEFKGLMANEGSRKVFFDASNKELGFNNISDFEETLGLKKKQTTPSVSDATPSASQKLVKQSGRELTTDISKFQQDPTAPPIVLTEDGKKTYVAPEPTPKPEEKKFKYDEASFSKMVKGMQEYQQGKTKDIQDFADPRLSKVWNEIKDKQSKNYNDPIGNFSSAVIQKASDLVPKRVSDAWNKGLLQGEQANIVNLGFEEMTDEDANRLSRIEQELSTYTPSEEERKFAEGGFSWVINNPVDGAKFIGETILNSLASQIKASTRSIPQGIAVGAAAGAPIGGVGAIPGAIAGATAGTIMAGLNIETSQKILQSIKDAGFDLKNPEEIRQAFSDRDMIEKFRILGLKRGVPIAIIDVFTAGIAGKVAKGGSTLASSVARKGAGLGVEAIGGSAGEFAAQVSAGEKIDPNAIALEGIAEVGAGAPTLVTSTAYQGALERKNTSSSDKNIALQITANKVAGDEDARNHLKKLLSEGTIDEIEFKDGIKVIEESKVSDARIPDNIVGEARAESIVLMNRKTDVQNQIRELEGKKNMMDEVYHPEIDQQIEVLTKKTQEIDNELINIQKQNDAIQKQTTDESVLRTEQPQVGLQEVGKGDQVTEVVTEEAKPKEEILADEDTLSSFLDDEMVTSVEDKLNTLFPLSEDLGFSKSKALAKRYMKAKQDGSNPELVNAVEELVSSKTQPEIITEEAKPKEEVVLSDIKNTSDFIASNNLSLEIMQNSGEFFPVNPEKKIEDILSERYHEVKLDGSNPDLVKAVEDAVGRTIQEQQVVTEEVTPTEEVVTDESLVEYNPSEEIKDKDMGLLLKTLKSKKINPLAEPIITDLGGTVVFEYKTNLEDGESVDRITFERKADGSLSNKNILVQKNYVPIRNSIGFNNYIQEKRSQLKITTTQNQTNEQATTEQPKKPSAGNRLFNQPIEAIKEIANRYYERAFGTTRPDFKGTRELDKVRAKRISDAFAAMKHAPNDPKVREAYNALAKETIDQYKAFLDAGYVVEINNEEPYANSQEMIDDLRNNKRIKIFSTESGFGDNPITDKQRNENPLLATSEFKDTNGNTLLVNDLFRAVHDFFGHAELGNSFGPLGEENAWNVHARMFSPLARRAMTTETRGQNSYVNFSGVNEEVNKLRDEARQLREEGKYQEALEKTDEIYDKISFADQKVGLLPEEFSVIDEEVTTPKTEEQEVSDLESLLRENRLSSAPYNEKYKKNAAQIENHRRLAGLARKALAKIAPNVKIILHETAEDYDKAVPQRSQGAFISSTNTIHINLEYADVETIPHEVFHAILFIKIKTDPRTTKVTKEMFESVKKVLDKNSPVYKQIEDIASNYKESLKDEERLAELFGILSVNYEKLPVPAKNAIVRFIEKIAKLFGLDATKLIGRTDNNVINLLNTLSEKVAKGEEIQESEIDIIGIGGDGTRPTLFRQADANNINNIIKLARANGFSEQAISTVLTNRGFSEQEITDALATELGAKGTVEVTEELLPGREELLKKVDDMIKRQQSKDIPKTKIAENVKKLMEKSDAYNNATDIQKEKLIRDANKKIGIREKSAPSVARLKEGVITKTETGVSQFDKYFNDFVEDKKITMSEKKLRDKQLMDLARGGRDAKIAIANASKELGASVKKMAESGKLTAKQAANITKKFSKVNLLSLDSVSKFSDYVSKIFADADYDSKLNEALSTKKAISKLSRNKDKNANTRYFAKKFLAIDPSLVDNIDEYNDNASRLKESIRGSMLKKSGVKFADIVNIDEMSKYVDETINSQNKKLFENKVNEIQELMGIDASDLSYEKILELLKEDTVVEKKYDDIIRSTVYKMFNTYSALIDDMISSGNDSFTGEEIDFTDNQKSIVKKFMNMDLDSMSIKSALSAVDALANFMQNKSTAKMEDTLSRYEGDLNAKRIAEKGIKSKPLQKYWSRFVGRLLTEQLANLNIVFERMFGGFNAGGKIQDAMGVTDLVNKKSAAQSKANKIVDKYVQTFYETKPNGEAFNTEYNNIERGMAAFLMRNVLGTSAEIQAEFNRRKDLVKESIDALSVGSEVEQQKSEVYKKAFDKIAKDSKDASDVTKKIDKDNLKAVDFWQNTWSENYDEMSNVSENIYNKVLEKDLNYTPDKFSKLDSDLGVVELTNDDSAFHTNNGTIYKKESGVLMEATRPKSLPTNPKNGEVTRYIDLSFDSNMSKAMYDALVDINTAYPIRQIDSFLNSKDFSKIVPQSEDRKVLRDRIQLYVNNIRGKNPFTNDELSSALKKLNSLTAIGVGQALAGVTQPVKQVLPVAVNTLINAGSLDIKAPFDVYKNNFISNSGYAIANRGVESQAQIESLNRMIETASKTKGQKLVKAIENANAQMLEWFLVKPDVYIARASWLSYYENSLKNQGVDVSNIDYKTHELNKEAASYAQRMVDRQQNVSDIDMSGKLLSKKETSSQILVKLLLSFASFRMNQAARLGSDLAVLSDKTSTAEDKSIAARSVAGFGVELATFKIVSAGLSILIGTITKAIMGQDEDDEERNKRINDAIKGQITGTIPDIISPVPILDKPIQAASKAIIDLSQEISGVKKEDIVSIYDVPKQDFVSSLGSFGIAAGRASTLWELGNLSASGKYEDNFGNEKQVSDSDREALSMLLVPAILTNIGLAPSEVNTVVRNAIKYSKQKGKTEKSLNKPTPPKKEKKKTSDSSFGKKSGFGKGSRKSGGFGSKSGGFGK